MKRTSQFTIAFIVVLAGAIPGCGELDSNWDTSWWKQDRRVVKPSQRANLPKRETPKPQTAPQQKSDNDVASTDAIPPTSQEEPGELGENKIVQRASNSTGAVRPFYHLYLVPEGSKASESRRNEARVTMRHASPRLCAMLLELLYVPLGRSGSGDETYLIYEQPEEFERAMAFVERLDIANGTGEWNQGVSGFLKTMEQGAVVDNDLIAANEAKFAAIAQSSAEPDLIRWAAAIFAGKLAADYRYEYAEARSYYAQALRFAGAESIEAMTAEWWRADTYVHESATSDASEAYEDILNNYTHLWPKSHVIERSYAILKKNQNR